MNWQHQQSDYEPDALDRLLVEADWGEPTPEAINRLQSQWRMLGAKRLRRRRRLAALSALAAAAVLVAIGLATWGRNDRAMIQPGPEKFAATATRQSPPTPRAAVDPPPTARQASSTLSPAACSSRPPNPYELAVRAAYRRTRSLRQSRVASESAIDAAAAESLHCAVERPADAPALGQAAADERDSTAQRELLSALLARGDLRSISIFLEHAADPQTAAAALDCLAGVPRPPVETLFQCLHGPHGGQRMAAARVLGRLDQPAVSHELIAMVVRGVHRQEALVALLSSSEPAARQFVAAAAQNPHLSAALWNAKRLCQTSYPGRS